MNSGKIMIMLVAVFATTVSSEFTIKIDDKECTLKPGKVVSLKKNQSLQIAFDVAPGTGYSWFLSKQELPYLTLKSEGSQQKPGKYPLGGASSTKMFDFEANKGIGEGKLQFEYKRPWEKKASAQTETISYEVK